MDCLQYLDDLETDFSIAEWFAALLDAIQEMLAFHLERFNPLHRIGHGVSRPVREVKLFFRVRVRGRYVYTLVVDHDLVHWLNVIVNQHSFAADDSVSAYLAGIEPADLDVGHHVVREK